MNAPRQMSRGISILNDLHLSHQEGSVPVSGDAALQAIVEMQFPVSDNAFEAIITDQPGIFRLQAPQTKIVCGEKRQTGILQ